MVFVAYAVLFGEFRQCPFRMPLRPFMALAVRYSFFMVILYIVFDIQDLGSRSPIRSDKHIGNVFVPQTRSGPEKSRHAQENPYRQGRQGIGPSMSAKGIRTRAANTKKGPDPTGNGSNDDHELAIGMHSRILPFSLINAPWKAMIPTLFLYKWGAD